MAIGVPSVAALTLGGITQDEYDKKARELKGRQNEIALRIDQHQDSEGDYRTTLESLISVASRAADIFERSKTEQKRELIAFVFSNLRLRGKKLEYSLRSPFDLMVNRADHTNWPYRNSQKLGNRRDLEIIGRGLPRFPLACAGCPRSHSRRPDAL